MTKQTTKAEKVATANPEAAEPKTRKKHAPAETESERLMRLERIKLERETQEGIEAEREALAPERRARAAKALWHMFNRGELVRQTIEYHGNQGSVEQEMLYSHLSRYAKK